MINYFDKYSNLVKHALRSAEYPLHKYGISYLPYLLRSTYAFPPLIILVAINGICNLRCKMCDVGQQNKESTFYKNSSFDNKQSLDLRILKKFIDGLYPWKPFICVNSAEPLLRKDIFKFISYCKQKGMPVQLSTNGFLLPGFADKLLDSGLDRLFVSMDGPEAIHDDIRGTPGSYNNCISGIEKVIEKREERRSAKPAIQINYTITNHNYFSLVEFFDKIKGLKLKYVLFSHYNFISKEMADLHNNIFGKVRKVYPSNISACDPAKVDVNILSDQILKVKKEARGQGVRVIFQPDIDKEGLHVYYNEHLKYVTGDKCYMPWISAQIRADGEIITAIRCWDYSFGNIKDSNFKDIWNSSSVRMMRSMLLKRGSFPMCSRCCSIM